MKPLNDARAKDLSFFNSLKGIIVSKVSQVVHSFKTGLITKEAAKSTITREAQTIKRQQQTEISTRINGFKQIARNMFASAVGIKMFEYVGPLDGKTRDFCRQHIGEVRSMKEWNNFKNGQIEPVSVYKGGYNCRHSLVGVKNV